MSAAATIGTLLIFIFCALEVVGIATNYWMTVDVTSFINVFVLIGDINLPVNMIF
jgi:hypothetical protein